MPPTPETASQPDTVSDLDPQLLEAAAMLQLEMEECHSAIMGVFRFASEDSRYPVQLEAMKAATRMMQANAAAITALQRLRQPGTHHTVTIRDTQPKSGGGAPPQKSENECQK